MHTLKVTVAVPVYNAAKRLGVMFDSLLHQTMNAADFEIICVNDCSTDNSKEVIERHQTILKNIVLIDRTENSGGPVIPRNDAIAAARGEYIQFLDNDDFLGEEALERLYRAAKENSSDVIFGKYVGVNNRSVPLSSFKKGNLANAGIIADNLLYTIAPHKMFRLLFLKEHHFIFDPKATAGNDDQLFIVQCYVAAKVITVLADYPYYFVVALGTENLSSNFVPAKSWLYVWYRLMEFLNDFIKDEGYRNKLKAALLNRLLFGTRFHAFLLTTRTTRAQKEEWLQEANAFLKAHINDALLASLHPRYHAFWQAVKANSIEQLTQLTSKESLPTQNSKPNLVTTKRANVVSFKRPSVNAIEATTYAKAGKVIPVYSTVEGWFEIRRVEKDGMHYTEFIQQKDVRYTMEYWAHLLVNRIKSGIKPSVKKSVSKR